LKSTREYLVNDASAVARMGDGGGLTPTVMMKDINGRYKELMSILLLIASQVTRMHPHKMEELEWNMREGLPRIKLLE
jgi:hypothetical protein